MHRNTTIITTYATTIIRSKHVGLKMNITKTKVMVVDNIPINVNNVLIENVEGYVYPGKRYSITKITRTKECDEE